MYRFYFGGTSLLIVVVVVMDLMAQVQSHLLSQQYEGMMKKANQRYWRRNEMKVRASVKKLCRNCRIIRRNRVEESYVKTLDTNKDKDEILVVLETNEL